MQNFVVKMCLLLKRNTQRRLCPRCGKERSTSPKNNIDSLYPLNKIKYKVDKPDRFSRCSTSTEKGMINKLGITIFRPRSSLLHSPG